MLKLDSKGGTYEVVPPWEKEVEVEKRTTFVLKKLTAGEWNDINDQVTATDGTGRGAKLRYLGGTVTGLKVKACLVGWKNVTDSDGKDITCNDETKRLLPARYQAWLEDVINRDNGLLGLGEDVVKN